MTREDAVRKVKALLSTAEKPVNEHEAAVALSVAKRLMAKFAIDLEETPPTTGIQTVTLPFLSSYQVWETTVASAIARVFGTRLLVKQNERQFILVGEPSDLDLTIFAIDSTRNRLLDLVERAKTFRRPHENPKAFRTSYLLGASVAIANHLRQDEADNLTQEGSGYSIVLQRVSRIDDYVSEHIRPTSKSLDSTYANSRAFHTGYETGRTIRLQEGLPGK